MLSSCCFTMFSSSIRRVARTPTSSLPGTARPSTGVTAVSSTALVSRGQERRYSSSKPPVPPSDGSRGIDTSSQAPAKGVGPSNKDSSEKREVRAVKRRGKDNGSSRPKYDPFPNLPSVPSTQHLHPQG